jgi:hypothetical protein
VVVLQVGIRWKPVSLILVRYEMCTKLEPVKVRGCELNSSSSGYGGLVVVFVGKYSVSFGSWNHCWYSLKISINAGFADIYNFRNWFYSYCKYQLHLASVVDAFTLCLRKYDLKICPYITFIGGAWDKAATFFGTVIRLNLSISILRHDGSYFMTRMSCEMYVRLGSHDGDCWYYCLVGVW